MLFDVAGVGTVMDMAVPLFLHKLLETLGQGLGVAL